MDALRTTKFAQELEKTIRGYHMVNDVPIKEAVWESVLAQSLRRADCANTWKQGGHQSGMDILIGDQGISCKTTKMGRTSFKVSSFRMTKCNTGEEFTEEIDVKRNNYSHYCVLARTEYAEELVYDVYVIPSSKVKATPKTWKEYKNKSGKITKWDTDNKDGYGMMVSATMSNQLWIVLQKSAFEEFRTIKDIKIKLGQEMDYASLFEKLSLDTMGTSA